MNQLARMKSDLTCAFGFSTKNAEIALGMFMAGDLTPAEELAFQFLQTKDPFALQEIDLTHQKKENEVLQEGMIELMNNLNYRITEGK